jgi:AsmA protein
MTGIGTIDLGTKQLAFRVEPKLVMTTQGQGRAADPVGFGIPVMIDGPWAEPRIYPDMAGILDNPDAAYAKLKEMGQGLFGQQGPFGQDGGGLAGLLGGLSGGGQGGSGAAGSGAAPGGATPGAATPGAAAPGGGFSVDRLGETLGNLLQQGLGQPQAQGRSQGRSINPSPASPASPAPAVPPAPGLPAESEASPQAQQDSPAMNDVLRELFNR